MADTHSRYVIIADDLGGKPRTYVVDGATTFDAAFADIEKRNLIGRTRRVVVSRDETLEPDLLNSVLEGTT
jgi:hypothetical protein